MGFSCGNLLKHCEEEILLGNIFKFTGVKVKPWQQGKLEPMTLMGCVILHCGGRLISFIKQKLLVFIVTWVMYDLPKSHSLTSA